jgi:hypothetical protein
MSLASWLAYSTLAALLIMEVGSRLWHRLYYGLPFGSRIIGKYPYTAFMEKAPEPFYFSLAMWQAKNLLEQVERLGWWQEENKVKK